MHRIEFWRRNVFLINEEKKKHLMTEMKHLLKANIQY